MPYYVYILECKNGTYYTGYTTDMERRYKEHTNGINCKYTRSFPPKKIAASWTIDNLSAALKMEHRIKKLSKQEKQQLIAKQVSNPC